MQYHFPRYLRLKDSNQLDRVFKQARKISTKNFAIFYCANDLAFPRLGIIATKKNIQKANARNVFKRIVRESFRLQQANLKNYDYIVFAYKSAATITKNELFQCLNQQWNKLVKLEKN